MDEYQNKAPYVPVGDDVTFFLYGYSVVKFIVRTNTQKDDQPETIACSSSTFTTTNFQFDSERHRLSTGLNRKKRRGFPRRLDRCLRSRAQRRS
jgi:hypothetical protein